MRCLREDVHIGVVDLSGHGRGRLVLGVLVLGTNTLARRAAEVLKVVACHG